MKILAAIFRQKRTGFNVISVFLDHLKQNFPRRPTMVVNIEPRPPSPPPPPFPKSMHQPPEKSMFHQYIKKPNVQAWGTLMKRKQLKNSKIMVWHSIKLHMPFLVSFNQWASQQSRLTCIYVYNLRSIRNAKKLPNSPLQFTTIVPSQTVWQCQWFLSNPKNKTRPIIQTRRNRGCLVLSDVFRRDFFGHNWILNLFHFAFKITISKMRNLCSRLLF